MAHYKRRTVVYRLVEFVNYAAERMRVQVSTIANATGMLFWLMCVDMLLFFLLALLATKRPVNKKKEMPFSKIDKAKLIIKVNE